MKKRILVVDDDWAILELLKFKLRKRGFEVDTAKNEKEVWEKAFDKGPDLVILDIWLKNKIGTDLYENLIDFGFNPEVPVIFITALIEPQPPRHAPQGGKYALYSKPFNFDELLTDIERLIHQSRGRHREKAPAAAGLRAGRYVTESIGTDTRSEFRHGQKNVS